MAPPALNGDGSSWGRGEGEGGVGRLTVRQQRTLRPVCCSSSPLRRASSRCCRARKPSSAPFAPMSPFITQARGCRGCRRGLRCVTARRARVAEDATSVAEAAANVAGVTVFGGAAMISAGSNPITTIAVGGNDNCGSLLDVFPAGEGGGHDQGKICVF